MFELKRILKCIMWPFCTFLKYEHYCHFVTYESTFYKVLDDYFVPYRIRYLMKNSYNRMSGCIKLHNQTMDDALIVLYHDLLFFTNLVCTLNSVSTGCIWALEPFLSGLFCFQIFIEFINVTMGFLVSEFINSTTGL